MKSELPPEALAGIFATAVEAARDINISRTSDDVLHIPLGDYRGKFRRPSKIPASESDVFFVEVSKADSDSSVASFVLRDEIERAVALRVIASAQPQVNTLLDRYYPKLYYQDSHSSWTAVERLIGVEEEDLVALLADKSFRRQYALKAYQLIIDSTALNLSLGDVVFANGHNCIVNPQTAEIKLVEPNNLLPKNPGETPSELAARQIFQELENGYDRRMIKILEEGGREEEIFDNSLKRPFIYSLMRLTRRVNNWQDFKVMRDSDFREYIVSVDQEFTNQPLIRQLQREEEFFQTHTLFAGFSLQLIKAVEEGDFETFDELVKINKYKRLHSTPLKKK